MIYLIVGLLIGIAAWKIYDFREQKGWEELLALKEEYEAQRANDLAEQNTLVLNDNVPKINLPVSDDAQGMERAKSMRLVSKAGVWFRFTGFEERSGQTIAVYVKETLHQNAL